MFAGDYFCDIALVDWYCEYAMESAQREIVSGMSPILFHGMGNLTRAMVVKLLAKAAGADVEAAAESPFVDVPKEAGLSYSETEKISEYAIFEFPADAGNRPGLWLCRWNAAA